MLNIAGGMSRTVRAPISPFSCSLYAALAYVKSTLAVNSGFDSSFNEYSIICLVPFSFPVFQMKVMTPASQEFCDDGMKR